MSTHVKIKVHAADESRIGPVLASFTHGAPEGFLFGSSDDGATIRYSGSVGDGKRLRRLVLQTKYTTLEAKNYGEDVVPCPCQYLVGVYNEAHKRIDVYPNDGGVVFGLQRSSKGEEVVDLDERMNLWQRRDMLIDAFGSRKKQKMERSRKANIVDIDAVAGVAAVTQHLKDVSKVEAANLGDRQSMSASKVDAALMAARRRMLPPFNASATAREDIYSPEDMLGAEAWSGLMTLAKALLDSAGERSRAVYEVTRGSEFLSVTLQAVVEDRPNADAESCLRLVACGICLKHLLAMHKAPKTLRYVEPTTDSEQTQHSDVAAQGPVIPALRFTPEFMRTFLLDAFTDKRVDMGTEAHNVTYVRTDELQDKLVNHIACCGLMLREFNCPFSLLAADLKLSTTTLGKHFKELGCGISKDGSGPVATLSAPLNFPRPKYTRKRA